MNSRSSRSHTVIRINIQKQDQKSQETTNSLIQIVDLAGSEKAGLAISDKSFVESKHINLSLSSLTNVVKALQMKKKHVPFRDSKLTRILKNSLIGHAKISMIVCCSPSRDDISETISSLTFGMCVQSLARPTLKQSVEKIETSDFWRNKYELLCIDNSLDMSLENITNEKNEEVNIYLII